MASGSRDYSSEQEWVLAKQGLKLLINNKAKEAEALFLQYPESLIMFSGYSYVVFMDALMSFEEDKLAKAIKTLKEVERRCNNRGWFKFVKTKMFGSSEVEPSLTESLETQIILADSQVCLAILVFLQQDISGYLKAGWVLRKAWKVYQSTYTDILNLYNKQIGPLNLPDPTSICSSSDNVVNIEKEILAAPDELTDIRTSSSGYILSNPFPHSQSAHLDRDLHSSDNPTSLNGLLSNPPSPKSYKNSMKKSFSVNGTLSKTGGWSSRFGYMSNSLSFNYFTSTFGFFSSERL